MFGFGDYRSRDCQGVSRRSFLRFGATLPLAAGMLTGGGAVHAADAPKARSVLLIWLVGGPSHLDLFDPKPDAPAEYRGPFAAIATRTAGLRFSELLPRLAARSDRFSVVRTNINYHGGHRPAGSIAWTCGATDLVLSRDLTDATQLPAVVVAGGFAAILALFALLVTETDEAFANVYSASVSPQNLMPRASQPILITGITVVATIGALVVDLVSYQTFLLLLGSFFVPLFAVLLAPWLASGRHYTSEDVFEAPAWRPGLIAAWLAGFAAYQWLYPTGPSWWTDLVARLDPPSWEIGATLPSFALSFAIALVVSAIGARSPTVPA